MDTVGILYPGEMGHSVARVLLEDGFRVVTTLAGRSERTRRLALSTKATLVDTPAEVVRQSDLILSIVPPAAAQPVALSVAQALDGAGHCPLYTDANAISPMTSQAIGKVVGAAGARYIDACIIGPAANVRERCTFYVSGPHRQEFEKILGRSLPTQVLGQEIGQASAFKMAFAGFTKGMSALFLELTLAARKMGFLEELLHRYKAMLPGVMEMMQWFIPTFPLHAQRRGDEMAELASMLLHMGMTPNMARGSQQVLAAMAELKLAERYPEAAEQRWGLHQVVEILHQEGMLDLTAS
jgi:3-hydroxyisobutyrate dehydrogenase-like beta-hydroxyacid dehydrogenase